MLFYYVFESPFTGKNINTSVFLAVHLLPVISITDFIVLEGLGSGLGF